MELKSLRHFVALVEHQGFARAGEAIGLSQPALSRSIQTLEQRLGCDLINRGGKGVELTPQGQLVLEHAQRLLAGCSAQRPSAPARRLPQSAAAAGPKRQSPQSCRHGPRRCHRWNRQLLLLRPARCGSQLLLHLPQAAVRVRVA